MSESTAKQSLTRRSLLTGAGAITLTALTGCAGDTVYSVTEETQQDLWSARANELEQYEVNGDENYIYELDKGGQYAGKEMSHTPVVELDDLTAKINVNHPMNVDHWITTVYLKDQSGTVVFLREFLPQDQNMDGKLSFDVELPTGVTKLQAYAFCNKHDLWKSTEVSVG